MGRKEFVGARGGLGGHPFDLCRDGFQTCPGQGLVRVSSLVSSLACPDKSLLALMMGLS